MNDLEWYEKAVANGYGLDGDDVRELTDKIRELQEENEHLKAELAKVPALVGKQNGRLSRRVHKAEAEALQLRELIVEWKVRAERMGNGLQVGRDGADDGSMSHGRLDMLEECIDDVEALTTTPNTTTLSELVEAAKRQEEANESLTFEEYIIETYRTNEKYRRYQKVSDEDNISKPRPLPVVR